MYTFVYVYVHSHIAVAKYPTWKINGYAILKGKLTLSHDATHDASRCEDLTAYFCT